MDGFNHFPIFLYNNSFSSSLTSATFEVYLIEGNCVSPHSKKLHRETLSFSITNKDLTEEQPFHLVQFSQNRQIKLSKGGVYTIVLVNITRKQYEDDKNRLFICYGGMPESTVEEIEEGLLHQQHSSQLVVGKKDNLLIQYLPSDFTQIGEFHKSEGESAELMVNDRREDTEFNYTDYFIPSIHFLQLAGHAETQVPPSQHQFQSFQ